MKTIEDLVAGFGMVQLSLKGRSLRIRPHKFSSGSFFATVRDGADEFSFSLSDKESVKELIIIFRNDEAWDDKKKKLYGS